MHPKDSPEASPKESRQFDPMAIRSMLNNDRTSRSAENTSHDSEGHRYRRPSFQVSPLARPQPRRRRTDPLLSMEGNSAMLPSMYADREPYSPTLPSPMSFAPIHTTVSPRRSGRVVGGRTSRPKYTETQGFFIWYHRTDLCQSWDQVGQAFEVHFGEARPKGGLQCKFYRMLGQWQVEKVRAQTGEAPGRKDCVGAYGVVQRTTKRFDWMTKEHYNSSALPQFRTRGRSPSSPASSCTGCPDCG